MANLFLIYSLFAGFWWKYASIKVVWKSEAQIVLKLFIFSAKSEPRVLIKWFLLKKRAFLSVLMKAFGSLLSWNAVTLLWKISTKWFLISFNKMWFQSAQVIWSRYFKTGSQGDTINFSHFVRVGSPSVVECYDVITKTILNLFTSNHKECASLWQVIRLDYLQK